VASTQTISYILGSTDPEQDRLMRQAVHLATSTEGLFRQGGIVRGQRVLDLGSGVGDVAILVARIVGHSGSVVGIERDPRSIARARARVAEAGLDNVHFVEADASSVEFTEPFDALVGRFVLQFVPDPTGVLRSLTRFVRPGGAVVFQEASWKSCPRIWDHLPLWSAARAVAHETFVRSGANTDIGIDLYRVFQEAGLLAPGIKIEIQVGTEPEHLRLMYDLLCRLRPEAERLQLPLEALGDFGTFWERLKAEAASDGICGWWWAPVGAWTRKA